MGSDQCLCDAEVALCNACCQLLSSRCNRRKPSAPTVNVGTKTPEHDRILNLFRVGDRIQIVELSGRELATIADVKSSSTCRVLQEQMALELRTHPDKLYVYRGAILLKDSEPIKSLQEIVVKESYCIEAPPAVQAPPQDDGMNAPHGRI